MLFKALALLLISSSFANAQSSSSAPAMTSVQALMSDSVANSVGVNTHINYIGTIYDTQYQNIIKPQLINLGVRHIRDGCGGTTDQQTPSRFKELAAAGIHLLVVDWSQDERQQCLDVMNASGDIVEAVEAPNETDNIWGASWPTQIMNFVIQMYPSFKKDSILSNIPVLGPSFASTSGGPPALAKVFPNASSYMDAGNMHDYSGTAPETPYGGGWGLSLPGAINNYRLLAGPTKPVWVTENGYKDSGSVDGFPATTQRAAAKYLPRQVLFHLKNGVPRFYIYQLINDVEDFGLLNENGTPRLQFTAVQNLISMFNDPGASFSPGSLNYSLSGDLTSIQQMVFQKRDGTFYLVLWQGVVSNAGNSDQTAKDVEPAARALTLNLGTKITSATVYQPSFSMTPVNTVNNAAGVTSLALSVPDHIVVIKLSPSGSSTGNPNPPAPPAPPAPPSPPNPPTPPTPPVVKSLANGQVCPANSSCVYSNLAGANTAARMSCASGKMKILSATFGAENKYGLCLNYINSKCNAKASCAPPISERYCGTNPKPGVVKHAIVNISCAN